MSASLTTPTRLMYTWVLCLLVSAVLWQRSEAMPAVSHTSDASGTDVGDVMYVIPYKVTYNDVTDTLEGSCTISLSEYSKKVLLGNDIQNVKLGENCLSCNACSLKGMNCFLHHLGQGEQCK